MTLKQKGIPENIDDEKEAIDWLSKQIVINHGDGFEFMHFSKVFSTIENGKNGIG